MLRSNLKAVTSEDLATVAGGYERRRAELLCEPPTLSFWQKYLPNDLGGSPLQKCYWFPDRISVDAGDFEKTDLQPFKKDVRDRFIQDAKTLEPK
jgi:hypothetical protein